MIVRWRFDGGGMITTFRGPELSYPMAQEPRDRGGREISKRVKGPNFKAFCCWLKEPKVMSS